MTTEYRQFVENSIKQMEERIGKIRASQIHYCGMCDGWVPVEEIRADPLGGDFPICIDCLAENNLEDNLMDPVEAELKEPAAKDGDQWGDGRGL